MKTMTTHRDEFEGAGGGTDTSQAYTYPAAGAQHPHAVTTVTSTGGTNGTASYTYNADGATLTRPGDTITYDPTDKPTKVVTPAGTQTDVYDAAGTLLLQVDPVNGATLYKGDTELHQSTGSSTVTAVRTYTGPGGRPVAERTTDSTGTATLTWLFTDVDRTVTGQVNSTTWTITHRHVDPFGNPEGTPPAGWTDNHGYLNKINDTTTGLTLIGARQYDPTTGRFTSVDPVFTASNPLQDNGYAYAANNPITNTDPTGLCYNPDTGAMTHLTNCGGGQTGSANGLAAGYKSYTSPKNSAAAAPAANGTNTMYNGSPLWALTNGNGGLTPVQIANIANLVTQEEAVRNSLNVLGLQELNYEAAFASPPSAEGDEEYTGDEEEVLQSIDDFKIPGIDLGYGRDYLGHFTGSSGYGAEAEAAALERYAARTGEVVITSKIRTSFSDGNGGWRYYDGLVRPADGSYMGLEVKSGTAARNQHQAAFDSRANSGDSAYATLDGARIRISSVQLLKWP